MMQGFPLGSYVNLVENTGRLFRQGKASISEELAGIFERLGLSAQRWQHGMEKLRGDHRGQVTLINRVSKDFQVWKFSVQ
jgi:hypothetical protein